MPLIQVEQDLSSTEALQSSIPTTTPKRVLNSDANYGLTLRNSAFFKIKPAITIKQGAYMHMPCIKFDNFSFNIK